MNTQQSIQDQIDSLRSELSNLRKDIGLIANIISRYGLADPRIHKHELEILDRLNRLDGLD